MEALAVERTHTLSINPHGEKSQETGFFGHQGFGRCRYFNNHYFVSPNPENPKSGLQSYAKLL